MNCYSFFRQIFLGTGDSMKPFLNAVTIGLKQSPRYYVTVDGQIRILRWKSFSYQKDTMRLTCCHKSCTNVFHIIEIKNKSLIHSRGTPEAQVDWSSPKIFDVNSYSMLSHETNDHKCTVSITFEVRDIFSKQPLNQLFRKYDRYNDVN